MTEKMLDKEGARQWLNQHGFDYTPRQMDRIVSNRKLPFRPGVEGKKLYVPLSALEQFLKPGTDKPRPEPQYGRRR